MIMADFSKESLFQENKIKKLEILATMKEISRNTNLFLKKRQRKEPLQEHISFWEILSHVFVFISNSIFHFTLSCLGKIYDFSLKVAKRNIQI